MCVEFVKNVLFVASKDNTKHLLKVKKNPQLTITYNIDLSFQFYSEDETNIS